MSVAASTIHIERPKEDFKTIYEAFYKKVYQKAFQITKDVQLAEDILQETFIKAYKKLDTIIEIDKIGAWLTTIANRTAIDFLRKEKGMGMLPVEEIEERTYDLATENQYNVETKVEQRLLDAEIDQMIEDLKPSLKEVFILKYKKGFKEKEIAKHLNLPNGTVKSRLHHARQQLKAYVHLVIQVS